MSYFDYTTGKMEKTQAEEVQRLRLELAEARAALAEVDSEFDADDDRWWEYWKTRHAAALEAAKGQS